MTDRDKKYIEYTNKRLARWYVNARIDYGVVGSGEASIIEGEFIIKFEEDGVKGIWAMPYFPENNEAIDYYFECWAEQV